MTNVSYFRVFVIKDLFLFSVYSDWINETNMGLP